MTTQADISQFGLTRENNAIIERIDDLKLFPNQMEAAKFAMSHSIRSGAQPRTVALAQTKWNKGGFDPQGEIAETIQALFPNVSTPYRVIEFFINDGLERLGAHMASKGTLDLLDLLPDT